MSQVQPERYTADPERYANFAEDLIGLKLADTQHRILKATQQHQRVLIVSGNGVGKSYAVAALILAFLYTNPDSTVMGTSGTYSQFIDTMWRPMKSMHRTLQSRGLPGRLLEGSPEVRIDDNWFAKVVSHKDPGNLEGRHAENILVVIEEADKPSIDQEHFDSAGSSVTDATDRMVAIANPPADENNVVYEKMQSSRWHTIQFSSFESHNVQVDAGLNDDLIPGLVGLPTLADDWEAWNDEVWPEAPATCERVLGIQYPGAAELSELADTGDLEREQVVEVFRPGFEIVQHEREDLDERWYRRRQGVIPPDTASSYRPFSVADVDAALVPASQTGNFRGLGYDVARKGGDWNVLCGYDGDVLTVLDRWKGTDHNANFKLVSKYANSARDAKLVVDAQGEGSGVADMLQRKYRNTIRFSAGSEAFDRRKFYCKWDEGLYHLGRFMRDGGKIVKGNQIENELRAAARTIAYEEKYYSSRNDEVLKADSKSDVEDRLGRSPDVLDAAYMAVWAVETGKGQSLTW